MKFENVSSCSVIWEERSVESVWKSSLTSRARLESSLSEAIEE